jgi:hypothetical protein
MPQVVEYSQFSPRTAPRRSWIARARAWLSGGSATPGLVQFDHPSRHMLRDIGLGDDRPGNRLLQDHYMRR